MTPNDPDPDQPIKITWWEQVFFGIAARIGEFVRWVRGR